MIFADWTDGGTAAILMDCSELSWRTANSPLISKGASRRRLPPPGQTNETHVDIFDVQIAQALCVGLLEPDSSFVPI